MNGYERLLATIRGQAADRTPVAPQLFGHAAQLCNVSLRDYGQSGALMADCQLRMQAHYRSDAVFAFMDFCVESEALGSRVRYYDTQYPEIVDYVLPAQADAGALRLPDPMADGRLPEMLRGIAALRAGLGDRVLLTGCLLGPMTLAAQLYGIENALFLAADMPERYETALDFATACAIRYGQAQLAAGAHLVAVFDPAGALATWLNIAGPTAPILASYPAAGADIATFDYEVSVAEACRLLPDTCLVGNLKALDFLDAHPERITLAARQLVDACRERGRFILSSGCEIPPESAPANIAALLAACDAGG
ncbi:uroporphyrinogen decarboxylase family protein [Dechloromonas agitata]|uniref:uroporphyrinogen decarboxylase family protein n=1 Tax=Dechloromonas agitata TaxID=73030 RepID=UPI00237E24EB|nr:uroporphyrinogen decarboxylase family protein [Dechloromonas agitata]MDE1546394.1 uroporphyrinogen decarboxylase family protein [Dechloromonas agitata]